VNGEQLRVLLISQWGVNPYQKLLVEHLQKRGLSVSEEAPSLRRVFFRGSPHVLHLQNVRPFLTSAGGTALSLVRTAHFAVRLVLARAAGIRIVWTAHDLSAPSQKHRHLDRLVTVMIAWLAQRVIVHSESARRRLTTAARVSERKVHVIPHGNYIGYYAASITRDNARAALKIEDGDVVFLLFGWVKRYKRVLELIRAFQSLSAKGVRLVIAGRATEPRYENEIRAEAAIDPRILLHLHTIADTDVQTYMTASDVAVFPYSPVLTSGSIVLAESFGKATLVASDSGIEDAATSDGTFFYDPAAAGGLSQALENAIRSRDRLAMMGESNRANAARRDWHHVAEATCQLYSSLL
jgi:beta-1,4-mannosyltransferase